MPVKLIFSDMHHTHSHPVVIGVSALFTPSKSSLNRLGARAGQYVFCEKSRQDNLSPGRHYEVFVEPDLDMLFFFDDAGIPVWQGARISGRFTVTDTPKLPAPQTDKTPLSWLRKSPNYA